MQTTDSLAQLDTRLSQNPEYPGQGTPELVRPPRRPYAGVWSIATSLPAKLLLLTIAFVMLAEVLIFVPSVANFRRNWLMEHVMAAKIASLALEASGGAEVPERLRQELLRTAGVHAVSVKRPEMRRLVLGMPDETEIAAVYDLRTENFLQLIPDALQALAAPPGRLIRVIATPDIAAPGEEFDVAIDETPLRAAMWRFARNIFWLSIIISIITAALVYLALTGLLVRPMMRITRNMVAYRENPEDTSRIITPSGRYDEVGVAEKELAALQMQLSGLLREKARLANVGLAVSKINHDLAKHPFERAACIRQARHSRRPHRSAFRTATHSCARPGHHALHQHDEIWTERGGASEANPRALARSSCRGQREPGG